MIDPSNAVIGMIIWVVGYLSYQAGKAILSHASAPDTKETDEEQARAISKDKDERTGCYNWDGQPEGKYYVLVDVSDDQRQAL